ncbi:hypothetical protein F5884DRAFT_270486 [Xylogone sp. PMI_703]|nr:hypothetical protein F5884DRAFT_270486 [Xylogone sp. PMI_703]
MSQAKKFDADTVWFITGCSTGLGKSFATVIHNAGQRVVASARNINSLSYLPDSPNVLKLTLDVTSKDAIKKAVDDIVKKFGRIDVLINNAGYSLMGDTEAIPEEDARVQLETLFWGPVRLTQEILPVFRDVNPPYTGGTVVQISSVGGWVTFPGGAFYHAGKSALEAFSESISKEMNPEWNIRFLIVEPGAVRTSFTGAMKIMPRHPAYNTPNSPLTQLLQYATTISQDNWSDPDVCADVLFKAIVNQNERPLPTRLLLGADAIPLIKGDIEKSLKEMDDWKEETIRCSPGGGSNMADLGL